MQTQTVIVVLTAMGLVGSSAWLGLLFQSILHRGMAVQLKDLPCNAPGTGWPSLAVLIAARNEAPSVEKGTRSLLEQDYPALEVIAVDDRSTDGTGEILDALARENSRLVVIHVRALPAGWLGKNHALQQASEATNAEWILLTDGDVMFAPGSLRQALAWASGNGLDHLTLAPDTLTETLGERIFLAMFCLAFALHAPVWRVMKRRSKAAVGVGAFNLIRAEAFRSIGGYRRLALSVDDDMRLGRALKFAGFRTGLLLGNDAVSVRWHIGLGGMIRGLEKNFFAALNFRLLVVPLAIFFITIVGVMPFAGLFLGPWWSRAVCAAGIASAAAVLTQARGANDLRWYHALFLPLGALAFIAALLRSVLVTLRTGGVTWRDHHYPLRELRDHVRRRSVWEREVWRSTR
ncbi:MAG: glycosyltransferase [Isosphaeraceae bacterium]